MPITYGWFAAVVGNSQLIALAHEHGLRYEYAANARLILQHALALQRLYAPMQEVVETKWPVPAGDGTATALALRRWLSDVAVGGRWFFVLVPGGRYAAAVGQFVFGSACGDSAA